MEAVPPPTAIMDRVREWKDVGESVVKGLVDCFSHIESREENLRYVAESLETRLVDLNEKERALKLREDNLRLVDEQIEELEKRSGEFEERERGLEKRSGELEKRLGDFERKEKEFYVFCDDKWRELALKEEVFGEEKAKLVEKHRLAGEKQKLEYELIRRLELTVETLSGVKGVMDNRIKEIESREEEAHASLTSRLNEAGLIGESLEKRFKELEGFEKELNLSQERPKELESEEGQLVELRGGKLTSNEFIKDTSSISLIINEQKTINRKRKQPESSLVSAKGKKSKVKKQIGKCFKCGEKGHWKPDCPHLKKDNDLGNNATSKGEI